MSKGEELFALQLRAAGIGGWVREHKFHDTRRWRFDFAWPELKVAAEIEGGTWVAGRHNRGAGYEKDLEKYNAALPYGWDVARFTTGMVERGAALATIQILLDYKANNKG